MADAATSHNASKKIKMPQKKYYRQRAHCNPLSFSDSFDYPPDPSKFDYENHYPHFAATVRGQPRILCPRFLFIVLYYLCFCVGTWTPS